MAPAARLSIYKVLWHNQTTGGASAGTADLVAAIEDATRDGVDVINYSISGSRQFVVDPVEIAFLNAAAAGVFVAASAARSGSRGMVMVLMTIDGVSAALQVVEHTASHTTRSGIPNLALAIVGLLLFGGAWALIPRWWRTGLPGDRFFNDHLTRAFLGNMVFMACLTLVFVLIVVKDYGWISLDAAKILILPLAVTAVLAVVSIGTIYLFNRPKFMVPPRLRGQRGRLSKHHREVEQR